MKHTGWDSKIADEIPILIIGFDGNGKVLSGNRAAYENLNYSREEFATCTIQELFRQIFPVSDGQLPAYDRERFLQETETNIYRREGMCFPVQIKFSVAEDGTDYLLAEDLTERYKLSTALQKMAEESEQNQKMRNEFTANVTHELRTPVNGIKGNVLELLESVTDGGQRKSLELILYCCDNISSLINNILDFSKLEADKVVLEEREFDFYKLMDKIIELHMPSVKEKGLKFGVRIDESIPQYLLGDELRLNQILNNLLSNAIKFTSIGSIGLEVSMTVQHGSHLELFFMVRDTGIGISKEEQDKLFASFQQVDASISRRFGGTGLGLAITKQLIEMMDGRIYVESEKGKGSTFSFNIILHPGHNGKTREELDQTYRKWAELEADLEESEGQKNVCQFGTEENRAELEKNMNKLMLSIELQSWEKAEQLIELVKFLCEGADDNIKKRFLRMEMAVRKEDYEKSVQGFKQVREFIDEKLVEAAGQ